MNTGRNRCRNFHEINLDGEAGTVPCKRLMLKNFIPSMCTDAEAFSTTRKQSGHARQGLP